MTNEEMKEVFTKGGVSVADIEKVQEKFDADKITEIVEAANSPEEAFENLHTFYPELEVEKLQEQCDFIMEQVEASLKEEKSTESVELTEDELENVAGGGFWGSVGNWFKSNWKTIAIGAAIVVGTALVCTGVGAIAGSFITATASTIGTGATAVAGGFIGGAESIAAVTAAVGTMAGTGAAAGAAAGGLIGMVAGGTYMAANLK